MEDEVQWDERSEAGGARVGGTRTIGSFCTTTCQLRMIPANRMLVRYMYSCSKKLLAVFCLGLNTSTIESII